MIGEAPLTDCADALESLERLINGNALYTERDTAAGNVSRGRREQTAREGQKPRAVIVCCSDSRVPPEHIFGAGIGELFVIRNAGNLMGAHEIGSIEYAAEHLGTPLVVVMGHTNCGAVASALERTKAHGNLGTLLDEVALAIGDAADPRGAERENTLHSIRRLRESEIIRELVRDGKLGIAAAIYDIASGEVKFLRREQRRA